MNYCQAEKLRLKTIASYEQTMKLFAAWLRDAEGVVHVEKIKGQHQALHH